MTDAGDRTPREPLPAPARRATYEPVIDDEPVDDATSISPRRAAPVDDATTISVRRAAPVDDATTISTRRPAPVDDATTISTRRAAPVDEATQLSARRSEPVDDATRLSARRSDPVDEASPTEPDAPEDTILRPMRPSSSGQAAPAPGSEAPLAEAGSRRAAYVPAADDHADPRVPRRPSAAIVERASAPSPRSLEHTGGEAPASVPGSRGRARARRRALIVAGSAVVVAIVAAVGLVLLLT